MRIPFIKKQIRTENALSFFALAVLFVISSIASPYFLQLENVFNILKQVSYSGIIALGMAFIIIAGGIDLSVSSAPSACWRSIWFSALSGTTHW